MASAFAVLRENVEKGGKMKILFDSHAHLNNDTFSEEERESLIDDIEASDVAYMMDVGFDLPSSLQAVKDAQRLSWCYGAVGVHPHDTKTMDEEMLLLIESLARKDKIQAIGEIGLDFHYNHSEAEEQRCWFRRQIQLANKLRMPIVIHSREADQETMDILKEEGAFRDERCGWFPRKSKRMAQKRKMHVCCFIAFQEAGNLRNSILSWVQRFQSQRACDLQE